MFHFGMSQQIQVVTRKQKKLNVRKVDDRHSNKGIYETLSRKGKFSLCQSCKNWLDNLPHASLLTGDNQLIDLTVKMSGQI